MSDALIEASKEGFLEQVQELLRSGADVNFNDNRDQTNPLYWATCNGHTDIVAVLLNAGAKIDRPVRWGSTSLHAAADRGHRGCMELLLLNGGDVNYQNNIGDTPLHLASYRGHTIIVQLLLQNKANPTIKNVKGKTALQEAESKGHIQIVNMLAKKYSTWPIKKFPSDYKEAQIDMPQKKEREIKHRPIHAISSNPEFVHTRQVPFATGSSPGKLQQVAPRRKDPVESSDFEMKTSSLNGKLNPNTNGCGNRDPRKQVSPSTNGMSEFDRQGTQDKPAYPLVKPNGSSQREQNYVYPQAGQGSHTQHNPMYPTKRPSVKNMQGDSPFSPLCTDTFKKQNIRPSQTLSQHNPSYPTRKGYNPLLNEYAAKLSSFGGDNYTSTTESSMDMHSSKGQSTDLYSSKAQSTYSSSEQVPNISLETGSSDFVLDEHNIFRFNHNSHSNGNSTSNYPSTKASSTSSTANVSSNPHSNSTSHDRERLKDLEQMLGQFQSELLKSQAKVASLEQEKKQHNKDFEILQKQIESLKLTNTNLKKRIYVLEIQLENAKHQSVHVQQHGNVTSFETSPAVAHALYPTPNRPIVASVNSNDTSAVPLHTNNIEQTLQKSHGNLLPNKLTSRGLENLSQGSDSQQSKRETYMDHAVKKMVTEMVKSSHEVLHEVLSPVLKEAPPHLFNSVNEALKKMLSEKCKAPPAKLLDTPGHEWSAGMDYNILTEMPINQQQSGQREGACSLVFKISHNNKNLILKMMINLIDMETSNHGEGQSFHSFLFRHFSPEYDIPLKLPPHKNIIQVLHFYNGSTELFKKFLPLVTPSDFHKPIDMANQTTFMIMKEFPLTLFSFMVRQHMQLLEPPYGLNNEFYLLLLYQLLSAIDHLLMHGVVHRDIKADNVFIDETLRVVLGDFGFARRLQNPDGSDIPFTSCDQVLAGNVHAWAPEMVKMSNGGPDVVPGMNSLSQVYHGADVYAVGRMMYTLLLPQTEHTTPSQENVCPHSKAVQLPELPDCYSTALRVMLKKITHEDHTQRLSAKEAKQRIGVLLFGPNKSEVSSEGDYILWVQCKMMNYLLQKPSVLRLAQAVTEDFQTKIALLKCELEEEYLSQTTPSEILERMKHMKQFIT